MNFAKILPYIIRIIRVSRKDSEAFFHDLLQNFLSPTKHSVSERKVTNLSNQPKFNHKNTNFLIECTKIRRNQDVHAAEFFNALRIDAWPADSTDLALENPKSTKLF